jgi:hypothetical protein
VGRLNLGVQACHVGGPSRRVCHALGKQLLSSAQARTLHNLEPLPAYCLPDSRYIITVLHLNFTYLKYVTTTEQKNQQLHSEPEHAIHNYLSST